jgi:hypothetical protein
MVISMSFARISIANSLATVLTTRAFNPIRSIPIFNIFLIFSCFSEDSGFVVDLIKEEERGISLFYSQILVISNSFSILCFIIVYICIFIYILMN